MGNHSNKLLVLALSTMLALAGCVGVGGDDGLEANAAEGDLAVTIEADEAADISHLGLELDSVLVHDANVSLPDGFHELEVTSSHADLVHEGEAHRVVLAEGSIPAGSYDQLLLRLENATVNTEDDGAHDHDDDEEHDHGSDSQMAVSTGSLDIPVNVSFHIAPGNETGLQLVLDSQESFDGTSFSPSFASVEIQQGGETVATETNVDTPVNAGRSDVPNDPPVSRIAVFAPNGDQVYEPDFDPKDGDFVNSIASGFHVDGEVSLVATESEPVAPGASIEAYTWELGDGTTETGSTVSHSYEEPGVYEVTLEVTDNYGTTDTHMVRLVTVGWTQLVAQTGFEDGSEWTPTSSETEANEWYLAGPGNANSSSAWHVGLPEDSPATPPNAEYAPTSEPVTLTSPEYEIPEEFSLTGYELSVNGFASTGELSVSLLVDGQTQQLATVTDSVEWETIGGLDVLGDVSGSTVAFEVTFTADAVVLDEPQGAGYAIDDLVLAGMTEEDLVNHELLQESGGGHDGHDHEH